MSLLVDDFGEITRDLKKEAIIEEALKGHPNYAIIDVFSRLENSFEDNLKMFLGHFNDPTIRKRLTYKEVLDAIIFNGVVTNNLNKVVKNTKSMVFLKNDKVSIKPNDLLSLTKNDCQQYAESFNEIINKYGPKITKVVEGCFNDGNNPIITVEDKYRVLTPGDDFDDIVINVCKEKVVPSLFNKSDNGLSWNFPKNYIGSILQTIPIYFDKKNNKRKEYEKWDDRENYLGVYIRKSDEEKEIVLFPDAIRSDVNNDDELKLLIWMVIAHEYAHALMDEGSEFDDYIDNKSYYNEQEESHANAFALRVLKKYPITPSQLEFIVDFINNQPPEYKKGIEVEENSANIGFDMIKWRTEKIIRQTMEIVWLQMRQYFNYDLDDFYTAFAFSVDYGGKNYTLGEPHSIEWCEGESYSDMVLTLEQINHFIVDFLLLIESSCDLDTELRILFTMCGVEEPYGYCVEDIKTHQILLSKRYREQ